MRALKTAAMALAMTSAPVLAALPDEIQVYDDALNPSGVFGVELHVNHTIDGNTVPGYPSEITSGGATRLTPEFSYGLGHGLEAGLYINGAIDRQGKAHLAGAKLRMKYIARSAPDGGVFYGINIEIGRIAGRFDIDKTGVEVRPILGWRSSDWLMVVNPNLEFALAGPGKSATPDFSPGVKIGRNVARGVMVGVEAYRDFGSVGGFDAAARQATQLFAVIDFDRKPFVFNFGVGRGFSGADRWTIKGIIDLPF
ncbi:MAG: hypothetical protein H7268_14605 [Sandarakinorhabdus sp.]|nr:hypothetical protein [Sandarakinorhabdus sp.]